MQAESMLAARPSDASHQFFVHHYKQFRPFAPMQWMERMFGEVLGGHYPRLVDLPTGAGKTELAVIWLLALAWYGKKRLQPVPRRLIWVVNRRVLVHQVFNIAKELRQKLSDASAGLDPVRDGLRSLSGVNDQSPGSPFEVVELRGQIVADRNWAIRPAVPQLIVGTADQIGSRLLFQGYGLGKWNRPQQAGLLGVDSWVVVDEAHLVPAFALTLRQLWKRCGTVPEDLPRPFESIFKGLPFWLTELSATPCLPHPSSQPPFNLTEQEKADPAIIDRILAERQRRVQIAPLEGANAKERRDDLVQRLINAAVDSSLARIAIFVREAGVADRVADGIRKEGIAADQICKITGRIRGYERDRLAQLPAFQLFLTAKLANLEGKKYFLVGTAAAEVGLDADADEILCDFAPLPSLLQRLGRLDRRGTASRRYKNGNGVAPTMRLFATQEEISPELKEQISKVSASINAERPPYSVKLMAGAHWLMEKGDKNKEEAPTKATDNHTENDTAKSRATRLLEAATWSVLEPRQGDCTPPNEWLNQCLARVAAGPVTVPPLTDAVLDYWSATTEERSLRLSPHPFLYGLVEDDETTPLIGVAFRLEVEALRQTTGDDPDMPDAAAAVLGIFESFPPLRAELHQIKLATVRAWLATTDAQRHPLVFRELDGWRSKAPGESTTVTANALGPNSMLVLPACVSMRESCKQLMDHSEHSGERDTAISDVLDGVSDPQRARYLRTIEPRTGRTGGDGAWLWDPTQADSHGAAPTATVTGFKRSLLKRFRIDGTEYAFRYFRPVMSQGDLQYLDDHNGTPGHLSRARAEANRLANAIAPGARSLCEVLATAARFHDEGKRSPKWQAAFGWRGGMPALAKLHPNLERPAPLNGFRHEWESLRTIAGVPEPQLQDIPSEDLALWHDLLLHLVVVHHGHLRPSIGEPGLTPGIEPAKQNPLRLEAAERFSRLQLQLGRWRLAYLEALLKTADAVGSYVVAEDEPIGN